MSTLLERMVTLEHRREIKERHERYREAATRLYPGAKLRDLVSVNETADHDGAFVEMTVWIPAAEIAHKECGGNCEESEYCDRECAREDLHDGRHACKNHV